MTQAVTTLPTQLAPHPLQDFTSTTSGTSTCSRGISSIHSLTGAVDAEDLVARLAEHQLLAGVQRALGDDIAPLSRHQIEQLVDKEAGRKAAHAARR